MSAMSNVRLDLNCVATELAVRELDVARLPPLPPGREKCRTKCRKKCRSPLCVSYGVSCLSRSFTYIELYQPMCTWSFFCALVCVVVPFAAGFLGFCDSFSRASNIILVKLSVEA